MTAGEATAPVEDAADGSLRDRHRADSLSSWATLIGPAYRLVAAASRTLTVPGDRAALRRTVGKSPADPAAAGAHRIVAPSLGFLPDPAEVGMSPGMRRQVEGIERAFYAVAALIAAQPRDARDEHVAADRALDPAAESAGDGEASAAPDPVVTSPEGSDPAPSSPGAGPDGTPEQPAGSRGRNLGRCLAEAINRRPEREREALYRTFEPRLRLLCRQDVDGLNRHLPRLARHLRSTDVDIDWVRLTVDLAQWGSSADQVAKTWLRSFYGMVRLPRDGGADSAGNAEPSSDSNSDVESELS
jgi:CRISPR system Cascade subunit CasB